MAAEVILALDPSSTCTGWAVAHRERNQVDYIRFDRLRAPGKVKGPRARIVWMADALWGIIEDHKPARAVIEVPSGHRGTGSMRGASATLAVYGMAAGFLWGVCHFHPNCGQAVPVPEDEWINTAGYKKQGDRQWKAGVLCPGYRNVKDPDLDIADAICLANWYCGRRHIMEEFELAKGM